MREKMFKERLQNYTDRFLPTLKLRMEELVRQKAAIRSEVEMWQMRNEELESRMIAEGRKTWSLKQIVLEQQKQLKRQTVERKVLVN